MSDTLSTIRHVLDHSGFDYEVRDCDPAFADTAAFCEHYGIRPEDSANTILVKSKSGERKFAACVLLATHRLDVNRTVRKKLGTRRISFAGADETRELTGMEPGGVTPLALPADVPVWIDAAVLERERVVLGGGNRSSKIHVDPRILLTLPGAESVEALAHIADT